MLCSVCPYWSLYKNVSVLVERVPLWIVVLVVVATCFCFCFVLRVNSWSLFIVLSKVLVRIGLVILKGKP